MGIAVRINAFQDALDAKPDIHEIDQNQITIGSYNDDSIKLDHRKLQGKHIRIHSEWNRNNGETRLVVTNISGSSRLLVGNRLLNEDESQVLDESMRIQMGDYRLTAAIFNAHIPSVLDIQATSSDIAGSEKVESEKSGTFSLDAFSPDDLNMDSAVQSLLGTSETKKVDTKTAEQSATPAVAEPESSAEPKEANTEKQHDETEAESVEEETLSAKIFGQIRRAELNPEPEPQDAETESKSESPLQKLLAGANQTTAAETVADKEAETKAESSTVEHVEQKNEVQIETAEPETTENRTNSVPERQIPDNIVPIQKPEPRMAPAATEHAAVGVVEQMLFEHIAGEDDVQALDFDALRLLKIQGRITHHERPLAGLPVDGGPLGQTSSDQEGYFSFDNVVEGTHYQINIDHEGYLLDGKDRLSGILTQDLNAELPATRLTRVTGRLTHGGKPLAGIQLDAGDYGSCTSDSNGCYSFENIPEGAKLAISAKQSGYTFRRKSGAGQSAVSRQTVAKPAEIKPPTTTVSTTRPTASKPAPIRQEITADSAQDDEFASSLAILTGRNQAMAG